jgi:hypothetical protein
MRTNVAPRRRPKIWSRVLGEGACLHHVLIGDGDNLARCLECRASGPTPFTIHGH